MVTYQVRLNDGVTFGIERHGADGRPVSSAAGPARQIGHMNVRSAVMQYRRDLEYAFADLVVCDSEIETDQMLRFARACSQNHRVADIGRIIAWT